MLGRTLAALKIRSIHFILLTAACIVQILFSLPTVPPPPTLIPGPDLCSTDLEHTIGLFNFTTSALTPPPTSYVGPGDPVFLQSGEKSEQKSPSYNVRALFMTLSDLDPHISVYFRAIRMCAVKRRLSLVRSDTYAALLRVAPSSLPPPTRAQSADMSWIGVEHYLLLVGDRSFFFFVLW